MLTDADLKKIGRIIKLEIHNALVPVLERLERLEREVRELKFDFNGYTPQADDKLTNHEKKISRLEKRKNTVN